MNDHTTSPDNSTTEEWRDIPGFEGLYAVSSHGRIKRVDKNKILAGFKLGISRRVDFWRDGKKVKRKAVYRLMQEIFPELEIVPPKHRYVKDIPPINKPDLPGEEWHDIPVADIEGVYQASNKGRIKRIQRSKKHGAGYILSEKPGHTGYVYVKLYGDSGREYRFPAHQLVMLAFVGPSNSLDVNHIDGNKANNVLENLEYVTRSQNINHAIHELGTLTNNHMRGENAPFSKLSDEQARMIQDLYSTGKYTQVAIARAFNITQPAVSVIINNKRGFAKKDKYESPPGEGV